METLASAVITPVADTIVATLKTHLGYMISCKKHVRNMQTKMDDLDALKRTVEEKKNWNTERRLEVPGYATEWLKEVETANTQVESVRNQVGTCFNFKNRYNLGIKALDLIDVINRIKEKKENIVWTDHPIRLAKVGSMTASTSKEPSAYHNDFLSRNQIFEDALKALGSDNNTSHMIALCGMGGVGKTTIMKELKKVVERRSMFTDIVQVVIGEKPDPNHIQQAVAEYLDIKLTESTNEAKVEKLVKEIKARSAGGKNKFLFILDDIWQPVDLEDIGLSAFPDQGINFKVLLTSRNKDVCTQMGVKATYVLKVGLLEEAEALRFFRQFLETSDDADPELRKIGEDIVRHCCGLPIAIKTMAQTLRCKKKNTWINARLRLENHNIDTVGPEVFRTSYDNLGDEETKSIFLICGLFPEDYDIPAEELVRYGWGLKTFKGVYTIDEARIRLYTCIEQLINTNLLLEVDDASQYVKMHDLVRDFVLDMYSKDDHAAIVNLGSTSGWPKSDLSGSCNAISLTCEGMFEFPKDLKFPNLSTLKLVHGDKSLSFPQDFYVEMKKLKVISYENMKYPLLPLSPQCPTNLRMLHLHRCSLKMFDCSSIGNISTLQVLSFADSDIEWLPSTIGNLKELRLLDLTNCDGLCIDNGVLKNLDNLEELYMRVGKSQRAIRSTDEKYNELEERLKTLSTLECQFIIDSDQLPKNMSFEKLERFNIEVGSSSYGDYYSKSMHAYENTLWLVINKGELLESRMNEMFKNTQVLYLEVGDMIDLEDVEVKSSSHPRQSSSFCNLRVLVVSKCEQLKYLFTLSVANTLLKLEDLQVNDCDNMEELVHIGVSGEESITFPQLKFLSLRWLPNLSGLCHDVKVTKFPKLLNLELEGIPGFTSIYPDNKLETSSFFKEEVEIPKLEKLIIKDMENLKEIWPHEFKKKPEDVKLRYIEVTRCDNLEDLFPCNPMPLLHHLEELEVANCGSIEVLFNIDLDSICEIGEGSTSTLRSIEVSESQNLREVWRIKGADNSTLQVCGFQAVESIRIQDCKRFRNVFTPITSNFDLGALTEIYIRDCGENKESTESSQESSEEEISINGDCGESREPTESSQEEIPINGDCGENRESTESSQESSEEEINILSSEETSAVSDSIFVHPSSLMHSVKNLHKLDLRNYEGKEVVFGIESLTSRDLVTTHHNQQQPLQLLPNLEELDISWMGEMSHVWKCSNWNKFLQQSESSFNNLTTIHVESCKSIKYFFSPLMAKLLSNLKEVEIDECNSIEEIVSNRDDDEGGEKTTFTSASTSSDTSTALFPHLDCLTFSSLPNLKCIGGGGGYANGGNNEILFNNSTTTASVDLFKSCEAGGVSWSLCQYAREISIWRCHALSSVIPCYAAGEMQKLQVLKIEWCKGIKEVFESEKKNSDCDEGNGTGTLPIPAGLINHVTTHVLKLTNLKTLTIEYCNRLEHVFPFSALESLRQLEVLEIRVCRAMKVIVKKEEDEDGEQQTTTKASPSSSSSSKEVVVFPRLKSIKLKYLPELVGFFLGMNIEFRFPTLEYVWIEKCPKMMVFAPGGSTAPQLKYINTNFGKYSVDERGLNFHVTTTTGDHLQTPFPSLDSFPAATTSEGMPYCSFHNLIELHVEFSHDVSKIIPSNELLQVQKLEKIRLRYCDLVEEVFEALEAGRNSSTSGFDESSETETTTTLVKLPNMTQVEVEYLDSLRYIWKSNQWTAFEFPNLTTLSIRECHKLEHVFTSSMVGSLLQLQELKIWNCENMEEVFVRDAHVAVEAEEGEEESNDKTNKIIVLLPRLKSLTLAYLQCLKGFSLVKEDFSFPLLDTLIIRHCPRITTFTKGNSAIPKLREIETSFGSFYVPGEDINSLIKIKQEDFKRDGIDSDSSDSS